MNFDEFAQANKAFELMNLDERLHVLEEFEHLRYPSLRDRFFEAVYQVIHKKDLAKVGPTRIDHP